jgi:glycosyltransferase involved in cell wall biosynthesis
VDAGPQTENGVMSRFAKTPEAIAGVYVFVLLLVGLYPSGQLGDTIAFSFALLWLFAFRRRRFAVRLCLFASFVAMCLFAALHSGAADAFGDGVFAGLIFVIAAMRRPNVTGALRVLLVTRHDAERVGGTETYLRSFLRSVDAGTRDIFVRFATFEQGIVHRDYERASFFTRKGGWFFRYARANEERIVQKSIWNTIVLVAIAFDLASIAAAASDHGETDVVYGVGGMIPNVAAILAGAVLGKPVLCHFHMDFFFARFSAPFRAMLRSFFSRARYIVANTQASIDDFERIGYPPERCEVILNWVFPEDFQGAAPAALRAEPNEKIALFVGRLYREKGIELVLRAFERTPKTVRLVIAGDGSLHDMVERWTATRPGITWLGEVDHARMPALMESSDCLVWGSVDRDALSLSAIEALASGLPVIASRRSTNMFEAGGETLATTVPPDVGMLSEPDEDAIAAAVAAVCSWDREVVRERCRAFVAERYSPANFDRLVAAFYAIRTGGV